MKAYAMPMYPIGLYMPMKSTVKDWEDQRGNMLIMTYGDLTDESTL